MSREFKTKPTPSPQIELRDFLAMLMPEPPNIEDLFPNDPVSRFTYLMKERYAMADLIIKEVR